MKKQKVLQVIAVGTISLSAVLGSNTPIRALDEIPASDTEQPEEVLTNDEVRVEPEKEMEDGNSTPEEAPAAPGEEEPVEMDKTETDVEKTNAPADEQETSEPEKQTREFSDPGTLPGLTGSYELAENGYRLTNTGGNNLALCTVSGKAFQYSADIEYVSGQNVSLVFGSVDDKFFGLEFKREDNGQILMKLFQDGPGGLGDGVIPYVAAGSSDEAKKIHVDATMDGENNLTVAVNGTSVAFTLEKDLKGAYEGGQFGLLTWNTEAVVSNITLNAKPIPEPPKSAFHTNVANIHGLQGIWKETEEGLYSSGEGDNFARSDTIVKNVQFSANVRSVNHKGAGTIAIRTKDNPRDGGYFLNVDYAGNVFKLFSFPSGGTIASVPMGQVAAKEDGSYDLTIQMVDDHMRVFANGVGIMDVKNTEHADAGYLALLTWNDTVVYQNVLYEEMAELEEIEEPGLTGLEIAPASVSITQAIDPAVTVYGIDIPSDVGTVTLKPEGTGTIQAQKFDEFWKPISDAEDLGADGVLTIKPDEFVENFMNVRLVVTNEKGFTKAYTFTINKWIATGDLANEEYRSQFHVTPQTNFMNDPNGMVYDSTDGYWHMFYQYSPQNNFYNQSWAHVRSKDLVNWEQMPLGIQIDDNGLIFSGCAIEDKSNTSGLFTDNKEGESYLIAYFTYHPANGQQAQAMAYSKDHGVTWHKKGVILDHSHTLSGNDFRDPKVFQIEGDDQHWYMVTAGGAAQIFASSDLLNWERVQNLTYKNGEQIHSECPMMYPAVDEETGKTLYVYGGSAGFYVVGEMKKNAKGLFEWTALSDKIDVESNENPWGGFGKYATMTFYNPDDPRTIGVSWLQDFVDFEGRGYRGVQSLPQAYGLKKVDGKYVITSYVVKEVDELRVPEPVYTTKKTVGPADGNILQGVSGITYDLEAVFTPKGANTFGFKLRKGNGQEIVYSYDVASQKMRVDVSNAGPHQSHGSYAQTLVPDENRQIHLRILVDQGAVEAFGNYGEANISTVVYCDPANIGMEFFTDGDVEINALDIYDMKSMYSGEGSFLGKETRLVLDAPTYAKPGQTFTVSANIYPNTALKDMKWSVPEGLEVVSQTSTALTLKASKAGQYQIEVAGGGQSQEATIVVDEPQFVHNTEENWTKKGGSWTIDHEGLKANNAGAGDCFYLSNATVSKDEPFAITTNFKIEKGQAIGVVFGVKDPENPAALWYCANIDMVDAGGIAKMFKNANGQSWNVSKKLDEIPESADGMYAVTVEYDGKFLTYSVNGVEVGSYDVSQDPDFEIGHVGFVSYKASGTIKDLVIDTDSALDEDHAQSVKDKHAAKVYEISDQVTEDDLRAQLPKASTLKKVNGTIVKRNISWDLSEVVFGKAGEYKAYGTWMDEAMPIAEGTTPDLVSTVKIVSSVNTDALKEACEKAKNIDREAYTAESVQVLDKAYKDAIQLLESGNFTQEQVDKAVQALNDALQALEKKAEQPVVVDKTALNEAIEEASKVDPAPYTQESWDVFAAALNTAQTVAANDKADQKAVDKALADLETAKAGLKELETPVVVDKADLNAAIEAAGKLNEADYTPESWKAFVEALNKANEVAKDDKASQDAVDEAVKALNDAQKALEKKAEQPAVVDKTKLEEAIQKAEGLKEKDYTAKSWEAFVKALKDAKAIQSKQDASQQDVDEACKALENAMTKLEKAAISGGSSSTTGSTNRGTGTTSSSRSSASTAAATGMTQMFATAGASLLGILAILKKKYRK
ncbi:glycoside hydrolase family 32 protein [uncultured Dubosiella sp.]|uniref:glycoside hydrolase family 32 protein n=4 Tax=uncultured Dubosiella sp. TaxID=1937011 RepID=UPI0025B3E05D|nr:GH32 C-terminal domain-containing protein [uncultured Dubosiella sp.]